jgi:hypothetical protein
MNSSISDRVRNFYNTHAPAIKKVALCSAVIGTMALSAGCNRPASSLEEVLKNASANALINRSEVVQINSWAMAESGKNSNLIEVTSQYFTGDYKPLENYLNENGYTCTANPKIVDTSEFYKGANTFLKYLAVGVGTFIAGAFLSPKGGY